MTAFALRGRLLVYISLGFVILGFRASSTWADCAKNKDTWDCAFESIFLQKFTPEPLKVKSRDVSFPGFQTKNVEPSNTVGREQIKLQAMVMPSNCEQYADKTNLTEIPPEYFGTFCGMRRIISHSASAPSDESCKQLEGLRELIPPVVDYCLGIRRSQKHEGNPCPGLSSEAARACECMTGNLADQKVSEERVITPFESGCRNALRLNTQARKKEAEARTRSLFRSFFIGEGLFSCLDVRPAADPSNCPQTGGTGELEVQGNNNLNLGKRLVSRLSSKKQLSAASLGQNPPSTEESNPSGIALHPYTTSEALEFVKAIAPVIEENCGGISTDSTYSAQAKPRTREAECLQQKFTKVTVPKLNKADAQKIFFEETLSGINVRKNGTGCAALGDALKEVLTSLKPPIYDFQKVRLQYNNPNLKLRSLLTDPNDKDSAQLAVAISSHLVKMALTSPESSEKLTFNLASYFGPLVTSTPEEDDFQKQLAVPKVQRAFLTNIIKLGINPPKQPEQDDKNLDKK